MNKRLAVFALAMGLAGCAMAERAIDYAAEDAGYEIIKAMSNRQLAAGKIAFLPLFGDRFDITPVVRAEMTRFPGVYEFYVRDEEDWNKLVGEIEFGDRRSDIMDKATIQRFGTIKGVEALLYGDVREAETDDGEAVVRMTVKLADIETGRVLWSANITGTHSAPLQAPDALLARAVAGAAQEAASSLAADRDELGSLNVYLMPMNTDDVRLSDYVLPEFTDIGNGQIRFFTGVAGRRGRRTVNKIAAELASSGVVMPDLERISSQLDQLFEGGSAGTSGQKARDAVLYGHFGDIQADENMASVMLNVHIADLVTGQELWSDTAQGRAVVASQDLLYRIVKQYWKIIGGGLLGLVLVIWFVKKTTRPR